MDNITQLFIRACKSKSPDTRCKSVYRRFYLRSEAQDAVITHILMGIIEEVCPPLSITSMYKDLNSYQFKGLTEEQRWKYLCMQIIALTRVDEFKGELRTPRMFK